jgi:hypothetical protein
MFQAAQNYQLQVVILFSSANGKVEASTAAYNLKILKAQSSQHSSREIYAELRLR